MDPLNIRQAVSLSTLYASGPTQVDAPPAGGLGGKAVEASPEGAGRGFHVKDTWERFKSRTSHGFKQFKEIFASKDQTADNQAVRFNARHEKFSGKVSNLVAGLVAGDRSGVQSAGVMATLRNDVKLLNRDAPWAARDQIFNSRLDIEFSKLSDAELAHVADQLKQADTSGLSSKDKADYATMVRAVVRQQVSRSAEMGTLIGGINHASPSNVSNKAALLKGLDDMGSRISAELATYGLPDTHAGRNEDIMGGAIRMGLQRGDKTQLPGMNRNLLNLEQALRDDAVTARRSREISSHQPTFRVLTRAVREEFLQTKVGDFQDTHLRSRLKILGSGAAHQVTKGVYDTASGRESRVHKYDDEQLCHPHGGRFAAPAELGIDQTNPRLLERAVVTSKFDERLGFNVSVGTNFARHNDQVGIVMELAKGSAASNIFGVRGSPVVAQRELIKLQLLDSLTAQADRHQGNYMVDVGPGGDIVGIKAIDSDFSMGPEPDNPEFIVGRDGVHLTHLPPVVDKDMARAIRAMSHDDITAMCDNMFDDRSVAAAHSRLDAIKDHLDQLESEGNIIDPKDWGTDKTTKLLKDTYVEVLREGRVHKQCTSYWQRDQQSFEGIPGFSL